MKPKVLLMITTLVFMMSVSGQEPIIKLTFSAKDSTSYVKLDSIKVMNRSQGGDTMLYWPDTVLILDYQVGILENPNNVKEFKIFQNYPNPVKAQTTISLYIPEKDQVDIFITDLLGRKIFKTTEILEKGTHSFSLKPGKGNMLFFFAKWRGKINSIKLLQACSYLRGSGSLEYIGINNSSVKQKAFRKIRSLPYSFGDELLFTGYKNLSQSGLIDAPENSKTYIFTFATNIPCPETPTVEYEGQVYNTIQIYSQCWLKENLNVGTMINGNYDMQNDSIIEKYCYHDEQDSCDVYGGLYQWKEMMQYTANPGTQGICPPDWHIATDEEWKILEGSVDSIYGIGHAWWDDSEQRGFNAGANLKSNTNHWWSGNTGVDLYDFTILPGGERNINPYFSGMPRSGYYWTSSEYKSNSDEVWFRGFYYAYSGVWRLTFNKKYGFGVRCLRDY